jgi:hypothetical protein
MICLHGGMYGLSMCFYSFSALVCNGPSRKVQDDLPCMCPRSLTKIWATSVMGDHQVAMEKFTWMIWATSILGNIYIHDTYTLFIYIYRYTYTCIYNYILYVYIYTLICIIHFLIFQTYGAKWSRCCDLLVLYPSRPIGLYIFYIRTEHGSLVMWRSDEAQFCRSIWNEFSSNVSKAKINPYVDGL